MIARRVFLRAAIVGMPALALAACGGQTGATPPTPVRTASVATVAPVTAAAGSAVALGFVTWGAVDEVKARQTYTDQFNKDYPAVKVTFTPTPNDYWNALQARMAGGEAPDVYYLEPAHTIELQCRNALLALDAYVQRDKFDLTDFYPAAVQEYTVAGKLWALARDFANQDIFYNVDLFKQKGLALPPKTFDATGWTFSDFLLACQQLTSGAAPNKTYGFAVPTGYRAFLAFVWSNGGDIVTSDASRPAIDQPNAVEGMQFL
ncbi:MAG TPA: extracellular solute-binding protein, partial [Chloroflexota bacterium]